MSRRRRWLLVAAAGLFLMSVLMPPWKYGFSDEGAALYGFCGWHPWGFTGEFGIPAYLQFVEFGRLSLEWAALAVVTAALWAVIGTDRKGPTP